MSEPPLTESRMIEILKLRDQPSPLSSPLLSQQPSSDKSGEWFILKIIGGVSLALVTASLVAGMFWMITSISKNTQAIADAKTLSAAEKLVEEQRFMVLSDKIDTLVTDVGEVAKQTKSRFTREDWLRESEKGYSDVKHNQEATKELHREVRDLDDRVDALESYHGPK